MTTILQNKKKVLYNLPVLGADNQNSSLIVRTAVQHLSI